MSDVMSPISKYAPLCQRFLIIVGQNNIISTLFFVIISLEIESLHCRSVALGASMSFAAQNIVSAFPMR